MLVISVKRQVLFWAEGLFLKLKFCSLPLKLFWSMSKAQFETGIPEKVEQRERQVRKKRERNWSKVIKMNFGRFANVNFLKSGESRLKVHFINESCMLMKKSGIKNPDLHFSCDESRKFLSSFKAEGAKVWRRDFEPFPGDWKQGNLKCFQGAAQETVSGRF